MTTLSCKVTSVEAITDIRVSRSISTGSGIFFPRRPISDGSDG